MKIRIGSIEEAVDLAKRIPDFSNPYNLNAPDAVLPKLDHVLIAEQDGVPIGFRAGYRYSPDTFAVWLAGCYRIIGNRESAEPCTARRRNG